MSYLSQAVHAGAGESGAAVDHGAAMRWRAGRFGCRNEKARTANRTTSAHQSEISNSRFSRSMITDNAALQLSRSALPNRMPLTPQLVSSRDLGVRRSTTTPMKGSQRGSDLLTAVAMATSRVAHL